VKTVVWVGGVGLGVPNHHSPFWKMLGGAPIGMRLAELLANGEMVAQSPESLGSHTVEPMPTMGMGAAGFALATAAGVRMAAPAIAHAAVAIRILVAIAVMVSPSRSLPNLSARLADHGSNRHFSDSLYRGRLVLCRTRRKRVIPYGL